MPRDSFAFLTLGNLPAAVALHPAWMANPLAGIGVYEGGALLIWFLIGLGIDCHRFRLRNEMLAYLGARAMFAAWIAVYAQAGKLAGQIEILFWLALAIWAAWWCVVQVFNRIRAA
jgi:hypothetical protein